eukprot:GILI01010379.1.p1 GENE.GILI01010379.1~~GILI01010379.1.p1  ORF type:complete len:231 (-),score=39.41 GILI01010379.1:100-792(-)
MKLVEKLLSRLDEIHVCQKRTDLCKHPKGCLMNVVRGWIRGFIMGYGIKATISLLIALLLKKGWKKPKLILSSLGSDPCQFGLFLGSFAAVFKGVNCLLRHLRKKEDGLNSAIAGGIAGLSILLDSKDRRQTIALYLLTRAGESIVYSLQEKGYLPQVPYGDVLVFCCLCSVIVYGFVFEPEILDPGYRRFLINLSVAHPNDRVQLSLWREVHAKAHGWPRNDGFLKDLK